MRIIWYFESWILVRFWGWGRHNFSKGPGWKPKKWIKDSILTLCRVSHRSSRFKIRHPDVMWMGFLDVGCCCICTEFVTTRSSHSISFEESCICRNLQGLGFKGRLTTWKCWNARLKMRLDKVGCHDLWDFYSQIGHSHPHLQHYHRQAKMINLKLWIRVILKWTFEWWPSAPGIPKPYSVFLMWKFRIFYCWLCRCVPIFWRW